MSGFAGLVRLDGRPATVDEVDGLARAIAHRGSDDRGVWREGPAAFAHAMLFTTPESRNDLQPRVEDAGDFVIVADLRLDNRDELIESCGLPSKAKTSGDSALVVAAFRRWGIKCPEHLEGDFAFAIWDRRNRSLFCARDPFGVKAFAYAAIPERCFAFGSEIRAPLCVPDVPRALDEGRIASYLMLRFDATEPTFYRDIRRLPGGCALELRGGRATIRRYWTPDSGRRVRFHSDGEYADGFADHLTRAIQARMRVPEPETLGVLLSGGLDSSSIAVATRNQCIARGHGPLPAFSWIFSDTPLADERDYQHAVLETGGFAARTIDSESAGCTAWTDIEPMLADGPPYAPNIYLNTAIAGTARTGGVRVLLDGLGGDSIVSRGDARPVELFLRGRAVALHRELRAMKHVGGNTVSLSRLFAAKVVAPLLPPAWIEGLARLRGRGSADDASVLLAPAFARDHARLARQPFRPALSVHQQHLEQLTAPMFAEGLELFDRALAPYGVEGRYPFFDRRLAEYCLALPADQKLANGYSRIVMRRAMEGALPRTVQWRAGKGLPGLHAVESLRANRAPFEDIIVRDPSVLEPYVDIDALRGRYARFARGDAMDFAGVVRLWSAAVLGMWLRRDPASQRG
ncbi:MAG TPA: asparagine synthase-related protein [Gemmatimonadaceae bacterium]|nr:asparagine synthase-related protein [Gemmatimonadaceae bacterium]